MWKELPRLCHEPYQCRRRGRRHQDVQPPSLGNDEFVAHGADEARQLLPAARHAILKRCIGPVGIVERQDLGLGEDVRCTKACGMERIALDLDRPPLLRLHEDAAAIAVQRQGRGHGERHAWSITYHGVALREERSVPDRIAAVAGGEPSERQRGAHEPQQRAPVDRRGLDDIGKFGFDVAAHLRQLRQFLEAAPEFWPVLRGEAGSHGFEVEWRSLNHRLYRWHVLQLVRRREASR